MRLRVARVFKDDNGYFVQFRNRGEITPADAPSEQMVFEINVNLDFKDVMLSKAKAEGLKHGIPEKEIERLFA